ncbi:HlyC/CorC family transporter [Kocuria coralli]|uniref:HlyC/CorC family transporter n=1 Tax=Kocuria coralli TaxID=1461025 RepID=A0A5J5KWH1_9MICC|nr:hemolysin family protein [Kocuria coralli]KAA9393964.1 HlyC/CorC family transporter [Kocuria coralli]
MSVVASGLVLTLVLLFLIFSNAIFVAVEFAYLTVNRNTVRERIESGDKLAAAVDRALSKTSTNLSGAQLGITVTSLVAGYLTAPSVGVLLTEGLGVTDLPAGFVTVVGTTGAFILVTFTQMVFGELVPKNWAIAEPLKVARLVVRPQNLFMVLLGWLVHILNSSANAILRLLGFDPREEVANARTAEELAAVVSRSGEEGTLDAATAELVARSIEFGDRTAADVMMPRPRVTFVEDESVQEVLELTARTGHARYPVMGESVDDIVGIVHFKDALAVPFEDRATTPAHAIARDANVVSESMTLDPLLRELRQPGLQIALVVDEYGGTAGIVTLEDLIEEIVGEIDDEQDTTLAKYRRRRDGSIVVSGLLRPDELGEIVKLDLPEGEETDTLGGLIGEMLDRLPEVGDEVVIECTDREHRDEDDLPTHGRLSLRVGQMDQYRVERVIVNRLPQEPDDDDDPDDPPVQYDTVEDLPEGGMEVTELDTALKPGDDR